MNTRSSHPEGEQSPVASAAATEAADLDAAFERALAAIEEGRVPDPEDLIPGRPDLREPLDALIELAASVTVGPLAISFFPKVDGYEIQTEIGRGGMGAVYLARQVAAGSRMVALKVLPSEAASATTRERFRREAVALANLQHPNVVRVYDVVASEASVAYSMEYVPGASLQRLIECVTETPRDAVSRVREALGVGDGLSFESNYPVQIARWGLHIAEALAAVHGAGLLHRDVKPSNILIRRDGVALLSDFGLVQRAVTPTTTVSAGFVGTALYAPPEQLRCEPEAIHPRADVFALGASLYHALVLKPPYPGRSIVQVVRAMESGAEPGLRSSPFQVPRDLVIIVLRAMALEPGRRHQSAEELADDLRRFLGHRPIRSRPLGARYVAGKWLYRHRRGTFAALTGALAAGAAVL